MQTPRFQSITARFSRHSLRTSFRRSSSASSRASSDRNSFVSQSSSPVSVTSSSSSIVFRQRSMTLEPNEDERKEMNILEPRPAAYFCSLEEQMSHF